VIGGGEPRHVQAGLGDDGHGELGADAGDLREPLHCGQRRGTRAGAGGRDAVGADSPGGGDRAKGGIDLVLDCGDGAVQERDVVQVDPDEHGMVLAGEHAL
jgi:hypothetical protein